MVVAISNRQSLLPDTYGTISPEVLTDIETSYCLEGRLQDLIRIKGEMGENLFYLFQKVVKVGRKGCYQSRDIEIIVTDQDSFEKNKESSLGKHFELLNPKSSILRMYYSVCVGGPLMEVTITINDLASYDFFVDTVVLLDPMKSKKFGTIVAAQTFFSTETPRSCDLLLTYEEINRKIREVLAEK